MPVTNKRRKLVIRLTIYSVFLILIIFLFNRFLTTIKMNGDSMSNTINEGNILLVRKGNTNIKRGDIIVYETTNSEQTMYIVKRVIGLPGDTISFGESDEVYINGELIQEDYVYLNDNESFISELEFTVGENEYFCMGDNRHHSIDSRSTGSINIDRIYGIVSIRLFPFQLKNIAKFF